MNGRHLATIASGGAAPTYRFYFHAQHAPPAAHRYLVEVIASKPSSSLAVTVKSDDAGSLQGALQLLQGVLQAFAG